jgi:protease-4
MAADKIFAEPGTLTGSIGVVGGKMAFGRMFDKIGVTTDVISRGQNSGIFSMNAPFSDSEKAALKRLMEDTYRQFTSKAAEGRKMKLERLEELAQGKVYTGRQAKDNGLVDELGTLREAIAAAKQAAGIAADQKLELMVLPQPKSFFEQMLGGPSIDSKALESRLQQLLPEFSHQMADLEVMRRIFSQPVNTVLPYRVDIR